MPIILSLIICSRYPDVTEELKRNIASTLGLVFGASSNDDRLSFVKKNVVGTDNQMGLIYSNTLFVNDEIYELIVVDNSQGKYSILSAYNEGVKYASGEILCFMHEDILFHTQDWGKRVVEHFATNPKVGLLGVMGTHFMSKYSSPWWAASMSSGQLIQGRTINGVYSCVEERLWGRKMSDSIEAVMVDGLWMCVRKNLFDKGLIRFDDKTFIGFHCYDADICLQIIQAGYEVRVAYDILIEHKSLGTPDLYYFSQLDLLYAKWINFLPLFRGVEMADFEVDERENVCKNYSNLFRSNENLITRLEGIKKSKAYKLGKFILKPFKALLRK